jgi:3-deoxy-D-manno-octulosonic-acid transferase
MWRRGGYTKSFQHRLGFFHKLKPCPAGKKRVWIQAVSVGEVLAVQSLIDLLQKDGKIEIVLTTTTSTGYAEALKRYTNVVHSIGIFPLDFPLFNAIAWKRIQPDAIILTESELWPEHLYKAKKKNIPTYLINARISDKSFSRYKKVPKIAGQMLEKISSVFPASDLDRDRLLELGCPRESISATGNIKFDVSNNSAHSGSEKKVLRHSLGFGAGNAFVLLGSSTWPGEEVALLRAQRAIITQGIDCRLLLVPRHAERAPEILKLLKSQDLAWYQRSSGNKQNDNLHIHLADTTGELAHLTQAADLAFIGKSLPPNKGGQTPIEAANAGIPIITGPKMNNFKDISKTLVLSGASKTARDPNDLVKVVTELATDSIALAGMRKAAVQWHKLNRGSSERIASHIRESLLGH